MQQDVHSRFIPEGMTRDCLDPWVYVEVKADGGIGLCCVRPPIGNLTQHNLAHILHSEDARNLRRELLTGTPDRICRACGLRGVTNPSALQQKVAVLQESVVPPEAFDAASYLQANADVQATNIDPVQHFLEWGRLEGRPLRVAPSRLRHPHEATADSLRWSRKIG
jgi:Iron-sulfur cluster-binding domain